MAKTLLVLGPAGAGKTSLIRTLAAEHPNHQWHLVQLEASGDVGQAPPLRVHAASWAGLWYLRYQQANVLAALPDRVQRITSDSDPSRTVIAFEAAPDPILRHAYDYSLRVFVVPPIQDESVIFRTVDQSRHALQQILRDSSAFSAEVFGMDGDDTDEPDALPHPLGPTPKGNENPELNEAQIKRFLACPLGTEIAARVHLQPRFSAIVDADLVVLNTAAGETFSESDTCWQKLLALLGRLHTSARPRPLIYACDLSDPQDPCFVRILHRMGESLCRV